MAQAATARAREVLARLRKEYPDSRVALRFRNPYELLVATVLSAQCTDELVNRITPGLFGRYPNARALGRARFTTLARQIRPTGFFRNKARNLIAAAKMMVADHAGQVPRSMGELLALPGVARKTANIVLAGAYGIVQGIAVDTHVRRLSQRLDFTRNKNPDKIEQDLMELFPRSDWHAINYLLIDHGRKVCKARAPDCPACALNDLCPSAQPEGKETQ